MLMHRLDPAGMPRFIQKIGLSLQVDRLLSWQDPAIWFPLSMARKSLFTLAWTIVSGSLLLSARAEIKLPPIFGEGMVLQRETSAPIWGVAEPDEKIALELNGQTVSATADADGKWTAAFQKMAAGGPFALTITGDKSKAVTIPNVLVGDVWICSGQSNMTLSIGNIKDFDPDVVTSANDPWIHCFTQPFGASATPVADPGGGAPKGEAATAGVGEGGDVSSAADAAGKWEPTTPQTVEGFTAMGYYFARELRKELNVPIGFIHISYGGSAAEAWMPQEGLANLGLGTVVDAQVRQWQDADLTGENYLTTSLAAWETQQGRPEPENKGLAMGWADPSFDASGWTSLNALGDWTLLGLPDGGVVWARREIDLPPQAAGRNLTLDLGNLKNQAAEYGMVTGTLYFNGKEIGPLGHKLQHCFSGSDDATVPVPGALVVAGKNFLALRIVDQKQTGPLFGNSTRLVRPRFDADPPAAPWLATVEASFPPLPADAAASRPPPPPTTPTVDVSTVLYNAMITPWVGYGLKGFVWDQGTANSAGAKGSPYEEDRAGNYQKLLTELIADWRAKWNGGDLPFVFTQHPNFGGTPTRPARSALAEIRDAQLAAWKSTPHTYMAVTLGLVTDSNIHYKNKKEAGHRLALAALAGVYGRAVEASGPIYDSMAVEGNAIRIKFTHLGGGLVAQGGGPLKTFQIAGADHQFFWADAAIDGDSVVVSSSHVAAPMAVRYAWADNPVGFNLYNLANLPASPFRTDDWNWNEH